MEMSNSKNSSPMVIRYARAYQWRLTKGKTCCVLGGCGFLGRHLVETLLDRGYSVNVFDIRSTFEDERASFYIGNICKQEDLLPALKGCYVVFNCATPSPLSQNKELFYTVNYGGTQVLMEACKKAGVKRLVLTSSASVVYEGKDILNGDEMLPFAATPMDYYTETKILQEKLTLEANGPDLQTIAIRPHGIFGPRDPHLLPTTIRTARAGKLKFTIGDGKNMVDFTYVENVVHGHIVAAESLQPGCPSAGKAYNITNDEPVYFWGFLSRLLTGLGYAAPRYHLPYMLIYIIACILRVITIILSPIKDIKVTFTPMTVALAGTHHFYSCEAAKRDLGYKPIVTVDKGITLTLASFPHLKNGAK